MRIDLENKLFEKYPEIFKQKDLSKTETCMCWGICVPDEWYNLIDVLCSNIQWYIDQNDVSQIEATQVKSKFGRLCFYVNNQNHDYVMALISFAEDYSQKIKVNKFQNNL